MLWTAFRVTFWKLLFCLFVVYITIHKYKFNAFYSIKATKSAFFFEQIYHAILACNLFLGPKGPVVGSKRYRHRIAAAYPRKGCVLWTEGDSEGVLSTGGRYFVDADGELRPPVHTGGAICGRKVPQGKFVHRRAVFCGRRR